MKLQLANSRSIGLVLSGGGVRGMAHIGLLKAMKEFEIEANCISGSSVGALIGALYANGYAMDEMIGFFKEAPLFSYEFWTFAKPGFLDTHRYVKFIKSYFPEGTFEALEKELHIVATNIQEGNEEFFSSGELILPLLASAALPPVFSPVEFNGQLYADGGIMNNFPLEPIEKKCDYIIGSNAAVIGRLKKQDLKNSFQLTSRVSSLMIYAASKNKFKSCDLLVDPDALKKIGLLDRKSIEKAFAIGYESACKEFDKLGLSI